MRADLHIHSVCSDGTLSPSELALRAKKEGVELFSLTDHDNLSGNGEAARAAKKLGLRYVRGIEISAYLGGAKVHVLGYGCREGETYEKFLADRMEGGRLRASDAIEKANAYYGMNVTLGDIEAYHVRKETPLHTMHVVCAYAARLHRDAGEVYREAFAPQKPAFSGLCRPDPVSAVRTVHGMGGLAVLAHPAQILLLPEELSSRISFCDGEEKARAKREFAGARNAFMEGLAGELDGIECFHPTHTAEETEEFCAFAERHGLFVTGGSDFHADGGVRRVGHPRFDACGAENVLLRLDGSV